MKKLILLFGFFTLLIVTCLSQDEEKVYQFALRTDIFSHARGNPAGNLILEYSPSYSKFTHSLGVEVVYNYLYESISAYPSIPTIKKSQPSGALFYALDRKFSNSPLKIGIQFLAGNYTYNYSRYVCLDSEPIVGVELCKCINWENNTFDYSNIKLSLAGNIGTQWDIGRFLIGAVGRIGVYTISPVGSRSFLADKINCPNIGEGGDPVSIVNFEAEENLFSHSTARIGTDRVFDIMGQLSFYVGYKF